ncbi:MAG: PEP-CTERM sorting domain-containing protein [Phycisphaerae bacterium]
MLLLALAVSAGASYAENVVTATQHNLNNDLSYQAWGDGNEALISKADAGDSVLFTVKLGLTAASDGKFVWAEWRDAVADWSMYDGFALKFTLMSTTGSGTIQVTNFVSDNNWGFHQPKGAWPILDVGDEAITYVDFDDCWDAGESPTSLSPADLNKIDGYGWQVITKDQSMFGEQVCLLVTPTTVPEPFSLSLLAMGGLALAARRKR